LLRRARRLICVKLRGAALGEDARNAGCAEPHPGHLMGQLMQLAALQAARARVLVADSHGIVAEGLVRLLSDAFDVVAVAHDGDALLEAAHRLSVDVILSEVTMPRQSGLAVLRQLRAEGSRVRFVFVTSHGEPAVAAAAMKAGANGYVLKASAGRQLIAALASVLEGGSYITPALAAECLGNAETQRRQLTEKQQRVLRSLGTGLSSKQVAHEMGLSVRTIEAHKYAMMQIMHVNSTFALVKRAEELGLLI
jgi:DNA-binding NarL/FixJ family response regulator